MKDPLRRIPAHPFLLSVHPIISLLAYNIGEIYARDAVKSLLISLGVTLVAFLALRVLSGSWQVGGLMTSMLVLWFFVYGRLYDPLKSISLFGLILGRHRYLFVIWSGLFLVALVWLWRRPRFAPDLTIAFNVFSAILVCIPTLEIGVYEMSSRLQEAPPAASEAAPSISWTQPSAPPDIYYILLDGYVRSDVLDREFAMDNSAFLEGLRQLGFYVADCAQSNYSTTRLSLTSTFNMQYLDTLRPGLTEQDDPAWMLPYLKHNIVRRELEGLGYKTIVFRNPWESLIWDDAAMVIGPTSGGLLSPFESLLLSTTAARVYLDVQTAETSRIANYTNYLDTQYALKTLPTIPSIPGPKFVFAHLVIPHPPFVFGPDGEKIDVPTIGEGDKAYSEENFKRGYVDAVTYIDKAMLAILPQLIRGSRVPPIIVIAGDHGQPWGGPQNSVRNLEAFFARGSASPFFRAITPVNIFRIVFDTYFNGRLGLLQDRSFYSPRPQYFSRIEIPNSCDRSR